jgi:hypothetical protein
MVSHRTPIISAAARNNVPAVYNVSDFARDGGLLSYGVDQVDPWRRAASYVDRILRGAKPGDLPVQLPTKFEMAVRSGRRSVRARRRRLHARSRRRCGHRAGSTRHRTTAPRPGSRPIGLFRSLRLGRAGPPLASRTARSV